MRLPNVSDLSQEQLEVCQAPIKGTTLVIGPPGSGKTVVALFRHTTVKNLGEESKVVVYNNVLQAYMKDGQTFYSWLASWWQSATGRRYPMLPASPGSNWRPPDFPQMTRSIATTLKASIVGRGHWGHLIVDEAQDFGAVAHALLANVPRLAFASEPEEARPSLTILADDNQRITDTSSTIEEIMNIHNLLDGDVYSLRQNYRNTREIAEVAARFYVGTKTGIPELPSRRGNKPILAVTEDIDDSARRIAQYALGHPEQEIGVLVQTRSTRNQLVTRLTRLLKGSSLVVQTYKKRSDVEGMRFDHPATVTVLTFASSKGLEFDTVFLPELQTADFSSSAADAARMTLYVMCSRARGTLILLVSDGAQRRAEIWRYLPSEPELSSLFEIAG